MRLFTIPLTCSSSLMFRRGLILTFTILLFGSVYTKAQTATADSNFHFDQHFIDCEKKWVVFPKANNMPGYPLGYIYMDAVAGFTFQLTGFLSVNKDHTYSKDTSAFRTTMQKVRLGANTRPVAIIDPGHYRELKLDPYPKLFHIYYDGVDSLSRYQRLGFTYNDLQQFDKAFFYLNKVYAKDPHHDGTEFELSFAYNATNKYDEAIKILEAAIKNNSKNMMFYRELGFSYMGKNDNDKAIEVYKNAIAQYAPDAMDETKAEMALNLAHIYSVKGDNASKTEWVANAKKWAPVNSHIYNSIKAQGL